jgi:hypothetical protein
MITAKKKKTHDLSNGEMFKFIGNMTNYIVVDYIYYSKVGQSEKILLPENKIVITFKTI